LAIFRADLQTLAPGPFVFGRLFARQKATPQPPASTGGTLIYAIGDIHGRLDLLNTLLGRICADVVARKAERPPSLIFLGDYVDRGRDSRGVIDRVLQLMGEPAFEVRALKGNHEEQMLLFLEDARHGPAWAEFGGAETLASYGVVPPKSRTDSEAWENARIALHEALPAPHLRLLQTLELAVVCGDYLFVHAGVRPGVPLEAQSERDLLWIRDEFLSSDRWHGKVVVHGHTPDTEPFIGDNRIGIDTGAYATGTLTAVRLCDAEQFILQTGLKAH
jgi:serine/threonine protein phosphatase 1